MVGWFSGELGQCGGAAAHSSPSAGAPSPLGPRSCARFSACHRFGIRGPVLPCTFGDASAIHQKMDWTNGQRGQQAAAAAALVYMGSKLAAMWQRLAQNRPYRHLNRLLLNPQNALERITGRPHRIRMHRPDRLAELAASLEAEAPALQRLDALYEAELLPARGSGDVLGVIHSLGRFLEACEEEQGGPMHEVLQWDRGSAADRQRMREVRQLAAAPGGSGAVRARREELLRLWTADEGRAAEVVARVVELVEGMQLRHQIEGLELGCGALLHVIEAMCAAPPPSGVHRPL